MRNFEWPSEDGWPYPDGDSEVEDLSSAIDDDRVSLHAISQHTLDVLNDIERAVLGARFGLCGASEESMRSLQRRLGVPRDELVDAMGSGLDKLRHELA